MEWKKGEQNFVSLSVCLCLCFPEGRTLVLVATICPKMAMKRIQLGRYTAARESENRSKISCG